MSTSNSHDGDAPCGLRRTSSRGEASRSSSRGLWRSRWGRGRRGRGVLDGSSRHRRSGGVVSGHSAAWWWRRRCPRRHRRSPKTSTSTRCTGISSARRSRERPPRRWWNGFVTDDHSAPGRSSPRSEGRETFRMGCSFHRAEEGDEYQLPMAADIPPPEAVAVGDDEGAASPRPHRPRPRPSTSGICAPRNDGRTERTSPLGAVGSAPVSACPTIRQFTRASWRICRT